MNDDGATELDAAVARLMLLPEVQSGHLSYWYTPNQCGWEAVAGPCVAKTDIATWVYRYGPDCVRSGLKEIPHYSRDMAAAWEVVEYLRQRGVWFCLFDMRDDTYRASFFLSGRPLARLDAVSDIAARAICLAALKVGQD
jgi:hypothetical protein